MGSTIAFRLDGPPVPRDAEHMTDAHYVDPSRTNFEAFKALDRDQPVAMLNLVRFRDKAEYPDDHPMAGKGLSGAEAYALYGEESGPIFERVGGTVLWSGEPQTIVIGPEDERWDTAFVAHYPKAGDFLEMATDPDYRKAVVHRQAAVETSRLIRHKPRDPGSGFG
ncbi:DUF1330 domain-containing protein [Parasphingopyxis algicola]|uniref:DUF1330 domain-containing protein n=1 Tax=Parasphingopyxis algicola TaxID=2026624 RepID=UPI0031B5F499